MRVQIKDGYAVLAGGVQGHSGEVVDVDDDTGQRWVAGGWATEAEPEVEPEVEPEPEASMHRTKASTKRGT